MAELIAKTKAMQVELEGLNNDIQNLITDGVLIQQKAEAVDHFLKSLEKEGKESFLTKVDHILNTSYEEQMLPQVLPLLIQRDLINLLIDRQQIAIGLFPHIQMRLIIADDFDLNAVALHLKENLISLLKQKILDNNLDIALDIIKDLINKLFGFNFEEVHFEEEDVVKFLNHIGILYFQQH